MEHSLKWNHKNTPRNTVKPLQKILQIVMILEFL